MSLVSSGDVRYQGVLNHVDMANSRITLVNVRCYGSEGRRDPGPQVEGTDEVYAYVVFNGSEIKELTVVQPPPPEPAPTPPMDRAILTSSSVAPGPPAPSVPSAWGTSTASSYSVPEAPASASAFGSSPWGQVGVVSDALLVVGRVFGTGVFTWQAGAPEDFDFEGGLAKFSKEKIDEGVVDALPKEKVYQKDDFFDELSCDALSRGPHGVRPDGRARAMAQRKTDFETFGKTGDVRRGGFGRGDRDQAPPPSITYDNALRLAHSTLAALQQKLSTVSSITAPDLSALHSAELGRHLGSGVEVQPDVHAVLTGLLTALLQQGSHASTRQSRELTDALAAVVSGGEQGGMA
ncbi:LSM14-like protein B [Auxenochlorella protothecoides]|uniref:LSM14-like protein B n=1 Tax=Auxenochlorella protothecoides TaxID=3075 RepID=A0A087SMX2_AUXPR|nr:LSM14-like protein B [Auxenochlorella protothecoides]KFM27076.1 LSM14-like protein B [Auxenochlorella protothecoides]